MDGFNEGVVLGERLKKKVSELNNRTIEQWNNRTLEQLKWDSGPVWGFRSGRRHEL